SVLVGSYSPDGSSWQEVSRTAFDPPLPERILAGLAVTSRCGDSAACPIPLGVTFCEIELQRGASPGPTFRRGDADGNGKVNLTDAVLTLNRLFKGGPAPDCPDAADVNDDGKLDLTDPVYLASHLFRGGPPPEPPGPEACGPDTDPTDALAECGAGCP
ncbi:MAG: hypothetical protein HY721_24190, partial [Planctomycetes bacterium]|nr:hypothetical protein [Planctomycetota bacterium]